MTCRSLVKWSLPIKALSLSAFVSVNLRFEIRTWGSREADHGGTQDAPVILTPTFDHTRTGHRIPSASI